ncbi:MAG: hypothetical protein LBI42_11825 [Chitinispirillales bacterium]|nr:hypothetical protein [Chitinispirillales bacterium]
MIFKHLLIILLISAPVFSQPDKLNAKAEIIFLDREEALNVVTPQLSGSCVARIPAWKLSIDERYTNSSTERRSNKEWREAFEAAVRDFSDEDRETLTQYVGQIDSVIRLEFPRLGALPWSFVLLSDSSGFDGFCAVKHIVLTDKLISVMRERMEMQSSLKFTGFEILIHEKVRILQLIIPEPFEAFYRVVWGFRKINTQLVDDIIQDRGQFLTSVSPKEWVIKASPRDKNYILPGLVLRDDGKGGAGNLHRIAITVDSTSKGFTPRKGKKSKVDYRDLSVVTQYRKKFPLSEYDYHPDELSADLIAKFLVMKYISSSYGTTPSRFADYSKIEELINIMNNY